MKKKYQKINVIKIEAWFQLNEGGWGNDPSLTVWNALVLTVLEVTQGDSA